MLAYFLAVIIAVVSLNLYLTAFIRPQIHRQDDFLWSGLGLFYALTLWICAGRFTGAVLLSQTAITMVAVAFIWENTQLRKAWRQNETNSLEGFSILSFILSLSRKLPNLSKKKVKSSAPHPISKVPETVTKPSQSVMKEDNNTTIIPDITPEIQEALENVDESETLPTLAENNIIDPESSQVNLSDQDEVKGADSDVKDTEIDDNITNSNIKEKNQDTTSLSVNDNSKENEKNSQENKTESKIETKTKEKKGFFSKLLNIFNKPKNDDNEQKTVVDNQTSVETTQDDDDWLNDDDSSPENIVTVTPETNSENITTLESNEESAPQTSLEIEESIDTFEEKNIENEEEGAVQEVVNIEENQEKSKQIEKKSPELEVDQIAENSDDLLAEIKENIEEKNEPIKTTTENQEIPEEDTISNLLELDDKIN